MPNTDTTVFPEDYNGPDHHAALKNRPGEEGDPKHAKQADLSEQRADKAAADK